METDAQILVKEIRNGLNHAESRDEKLKWLTRIRTILNSSQTQENPTIAAELGYDDSKFCAIQKIVASSLSKQIYECIVFKFSIEWVSSVKTYDNTDLIKHIFLDLGVPLIQSFFALFQGVVDSKKKDYSFQKCLSLLEEFLERERLAQLLLQLSKDVSKTSPQTLDMEAEFLINCLVSLPEKMANRLGFENSEKFLPQNYIPMLAMSILDTLHWAHQQVTKNQNLSLLFISGLVGRVCLAGQADFLISTMLPHLCANIRSDFIWCRICQRVFTGVPARNLEAVIVPLLNKITWYGLVDKFLGDAVVHDTSIKMLICTKLLLHRVYLKPRLLIQNIVGYLSTAAARKQLFIDVFQRLLKVWGDGSSLRHISLQQHLYISQTLMVCTGALSDKQKILYKDDLLRLLMPGVQTHLESSDNSIRMVGMTVAKTLIQTLDPSGPQLEFELDLTNEVVKDLLSYVGLPVDPGPSEDERSVASIQAETDRMSADTKQPPEKSQAENSRQAADLDLDSDDDLEPYDMSNDRKFSKAKPPKYIRDCMEGLISSSEDPDRTELCLQHAESLIRRKTDGLEEISVEFAKILLYLQDTHSFENFHINRFSALVALTVMCPAKVAEYLTAEFYERNYNLRQRMDILEVLAQAAIELSMPEKSEPAAKMIPKSNNSWSWSEVVQKRIDSNTRRFASGRQEVETSLNRFTPVAGQFFYPLMAKVDRCDPCLDLLGKDSVLLFRLLYTLAIVLHSSMNVSTVSRMGQALLEFTWPLRLHPDGSVRQAVVMATSTVFLVVPAYNLMTYLHTDVTETKAWLEDVVEHDTDTDCQRKAAQTLLLLQDQIKKEMEKSKLSN